MKKIIKLINPEIIFLMHYKYKKKNKKVWNYRVTKFYCKRFKVKKELKIFKQSFKKNMEVKIEKLEKLI